MKGLAVPLIYFTLTLVFTPEAFSAEKPHKQGDHLAAARSGDKDRACDPSRHPADSK